MIDEMPNGDKTLGNWMYQAAEDYGAARCCLLNGLFAGFLLAQQCVEKLLKTYMRIVVPNWDRRMSKTFAPVLPDVTSSHDLVAYAKEVDAAYPSLDLLVSFEPLLARLSRRFEGKYPDTKAARGNADTGEVLELDELAILLFTQVGLPAKLKVRTGLYPLLWHLVDPLQAVRPASTWVLQGNEALMARLPPLLQEIRDAL